MSKIKKIILAIGVIVVIIFVGYKTWQKRIENGQNNQIASDDSSIILFYGTECPHCQDVEKYIVDHQLDQKVIFSKREVWHDKANANLLAQKAQECNIKTDSVGVPFLWASGRCYVGVNEVENFLNTEVSNRK